MPTPRQHAKRGLKALRKLIVTLQEASVEGVNLSFTQDIPSSPGTDDYFLGSLGSVYSMDAATIGVRAAQTSYVTVAADEPEDAVEAPEVAA